VRTTLMLGNVEMGDLVFKFDDSLDLLGSGVKWKSVTVEAMVNRDRTIDFSGKVGVPVAYKLFGDFEIKYTKSINVDKAYTDPSWSIERLTPQMQARTQRLDACIDNGACDGL
jgi:hypothetical protein